MFVAYVDESGDPGPGGSQTYALGCVMVEHDAWLNAFDRVISFRRHLRRLFGLPVRAEIKANYLIRGSGPFLALGLSESARYAIYRQCMRLHPKIGFATFAVVVHKDRLAERQPGRGVDEVAWEWLLQRLERRAFYASTHALLVHDEGDQSHVQGWARKARRAMTAGGWQGPLRVPFTQLIDDPVPRNSRQSYFLQLADLCAYAAFRRLNPPPPRKAPIVPEGMWDELGEARYSIVTRHATPLGIVHN
jgi:hypothetical protein